MIPKKVQRSESTSGSYSQDWASLLNAALAYAGRGWHVFPVHGIIGGRCTCGRAECSSPGKHPLTRRGVKDSTTDERVIRRWWRRWRRANVAVATGSVSGIVVVDVDLPRAFASLHVITSEISVTVTGLTGGGGLHLLYRARSDGEPLRNRASGLPGITSELPGVDLRANGGYVIAPPSLHASGARYEWLDLTVPIAEAPEWLRERPRRPIVMPTAGQFEPGANGTRYGLEVLRKQLAILARAKEGERNHTLNRCAFVVARYVAAGHLLETAARSELTRVSLSIGLSHWETTRTIDSAFSAGSTQPGSGGHRLRS